ncbi:MAG: hypothetical protein WCQ47_06275 [bacterium]
MSNWLQITEYSLRKGISVSTIRRKIKSNTIKHKIENGKYFIMDDNLENNQEDFSFCINTLGNTGNNKTCFTNIEDLITFAQHSIDAVTELNRGIIEEKDKIVKVQEDTIMHLREQIGELKMLIEVLEKNN